MDKQKELCHWCGSGTYYGNRILDANGHGHLMCASCQDFVLRALANDAEVVLPDNVKIEKDEETQTINITIKIGKKNG
jgi:hypothetical protein